MYITHTRYMLVCAARKYCIKSWLHMVHGVYEVCAGIFNTHEVLRVYERVTPDGQLYNSLSFITTIFRWIWYTGYTHIVPGIIIMGINIG